MARKIWQGENDQARKEMAAGKCNKVCRGKDGLEIMAKMARKRA